MIFLHIGMNKTGSSPIQAFCDRHRSILREHGLDYPAVGIHDGAHYGRHGDPIVRCLHARASH